MDTVRLLLRLGDGGLLSATYEVVVNLKNPQDVEVILGYSEGSVPYLDVENVTVT